MQTLEIIIGEILIFLLGLFVGGYMFRFNEPPLEKQKELPNSMEEKNNSFQKDGYIERWMYVHELKKLINQLKDTDWLTPNEVHDLLISRNESGEEFDVGTINFHYNIIDFWEG